MVLERFRRRFMRHCPVLDRRSRVAFLVSETLLRDAFGLAARVGAEDHGRVRAHPLINPQA